MHRAEIDVQTLEKLARRIDGQISGNMGACRVCGSDQLSDFLRATDRFHGRSQAYQLVRCSSCSLVWLANPPAPEDMPLHYGEGYHRAIAAAGEASRRWARQCKVISDIKRRGALLDIGCSSGGFLATMTGASWKLYGIEMDAVTAGKARSRTNADVFVGDVLEAPFAPASFDVVTCFDVLEHVYDPSQFLTKVHQWLKPGGVFYTMLPNIDSWESQIFRSYWFGLELPRHISHFSPQTLKQLMTSLGFQEVFIETRPTNYIERSIDYLRCALLQRLGVSPTPQVERGRSSIPWRAARKVIRLSLVNPLGHMAAIANRGASMEAIFKK